MPPSCLCLLEPTGIICARPGSNEQAWSTRVVRIARKKLRRVVVLRCSEGSGRWLIAAVADRAVMDWPVVWQGR